jgi:WD40 repeat protein
VDGKKVAYSLDDAIQVREISTGLRLPVINHGHRYSSIRTAASGKAFSVVSGRSVQGTLLAVATGWDKVSIWNIDESEPVVQLDVGVKAGAIAFSPDGDVLALGDTELILWNLSAGTVRTRLDWKRVQSSVNQNSLESIQSLSFSSDGRILAATTDFGQVIVWWNWWNK